MGFKYCVLLEFMNETHITRFSGKKSFDRKVADYSATGELFNRPKKVQVVIWIE